MSAPVRAAVVAVLLLTQTLVLAAPEPIRRVDVFVSDSTPIAAGQEAQALAKDGRLHLWNLDDLERFNQELGKSLPNDSQAAARIVAARVHALTPEQHAEFGRAATGQVRADSLSVTRVPAVVINESRIYYGANAIERAFDAYRSGQ